MPVIYHRAHGRPRQGLINLRLGLFHVSSTSNRLGSSRSRDYNLFIDQNTALFNLSPLYVDLSYREGFLSYHSPYLSLKLSGALSPKSFLDFDANGPRSTTHAVTSSYRAAASPLASGTPRRYPDRLRGHHLRLRARHRGRRPPARLPGYRAEGMRGRPSEWATRGQPLRHERQIRRRTGAGRGSGAPKRNFYPLSF